MNSFRILNVMPTSFGTVAVFDASYRTPVKNEIIRIEDTNYKVLQPLEVSGSNSIDKVALIIEPVSPPGETGAVCKAAQVTEDEI